ncbi:alkaline phosphatase family protein [Halorarius litoreus]|uniref:alkaline phosphatase family protein n=1 Tax=Halorarius litoreus TaxID=2962676 RepID=UPI0020CCD82A|nr:alkaline phosphatase family protein [Halorarius litoreus]
MKTLLVGLDGVSTDVLVPLIEDGELPNIRAVFEAGTSGPLQSQVPPWTASAWPSAYTGVNPGKHGVFDFLTFDGYDWDVANRSAVREYAVWELLSNRGFSSIVVNVPVTDPPRPFDGALLPGYVSADPPTTHPAELLDSVREAIGGYEVYNPNSRETREGRIAGYRELTRQRGDAFVYLADEYDPDFGFVQFQQTDTVFHEYPGDDDAVREVFTAVDREVGKIIDHCEPENVLIVSDHGIGEYTGYEFRVNDYLREHGYVTASRGGEGMPSWTAIAAERRGTGEQKVEAKPSPMARAMKAAARVGITSQRLGAVLSRLGLASFVASRVPKDAIRAATEQVDFAASTAYMRSRIELGVRINLEGREPEGVVPESEYDAVRTALIELLSEVETPDGEPVFEAVLTREEVFDGPYLEEVADVIVIPTDYNNHLSTTLMGELFEPLENFYEHKPEGIIAASGQAIDASASLARAHLFDVTPTVLATFGLPASDRMDGVTLPIVEDVGREPYPEFEVGARVETADRSVEQRLADIGYLE